LSEEGCIKLTGPVLGVGNLPSGISNST